MSAQGPADMDGWRKDDMPTHPPHPGQVDAAIAESEEATRPRGTPRVFWGFIGVLMLFGVGLFAGAMTTGPVPVAVAEAPVPEPTPEYTIVFVKDPARELECIYQRFNDTRQHMLAGCFEIDTWPTQNAEVYFAGAVGEGDPVLDAGRE